MLLPTASNATTPDTDDFVQRDEDTRRIALLHILSQQSHDACQYSRHRPVTYNAGHLVWVWTLNGQRERSEKLLHRYVGPYRVLHHVSEVNYEVLFYLLSFCFSRPCNFPDSAHTLSFVPGHRDDALFVGQGYNATLYFRTR